MTTQQAFKKLLQDPELLAKADIKPGTVRQWKKRMINNKVSLDAMERALIQAGAKKKPEQWTFKKG
jgi:hypothetical protein